MLDINYTTLFQDKVKWVNVLAEFSPAPPWLIRRSVDFFSENLHKFEEIDANLAWKIFVESGKLAIDLDHGRLEAHADGNFYKVEPISEEELKKRFGIKTKHPGTQHWLETKVHFEDFFPDSKDKFKKDPIVENLQTMVDASVDPYRERLKMLRENLCITKEEMDILLQEHNSARAEYIANNFPEQKLHDQYEIISPSGTYVILYRIANEFHCFTLKQENSNTTLAAIYFLEHIRSEAAMRACLTREDYLKLVELIA